MLTEFVRTHRHEIITRCRARVAERMAGHPIPYDLATGIPAFLEELESAFLSEIIDDRSAGRHGGELLRNGFTVAQVVHDYGDACQTITELAIELGAPISSLEFRGLNRCLDHAIAGAVTEYERQHELDVVAVDMHQANQRMGFFAHELRNLIGTAVLAFEALRSGRVGIRGSTGDLLGRNLVALRALVDRSLSEVRLSSGVTSPEHIDVAQFIEEIEVSAALGAKARGVQLSVADVAPEIAVLADRQILGSILFNVLQNAFKFTRPHSRVWLRTLASRDRVLFEVEDQCGGLAPDQLARMFEPFAQHHEDHTGLGLGLAICASAVAALHGTIRVQNQNGGCVFTVDIPRVAG